MQYKNKDKTINKDTILKKIIECPFIDYIRKIFLMKEVKKINKEEELEKVNKELEETIKIKEEYELKNERDLIEFEKNIKKNFKNK